jgi:myo-inositol 2-dehydrogenase/D-chiro-inositol 1-dehydrogenase
VTTRIGFVGAGAVARRHAATLARLEAVEVAAVADVDERAAAAFAAATGARAHRDRRAMLDGEDLDAVYVCVPPFAHGAPEEDVVARGLALFVEKPPARDVETAERVAARIREAGVLTATGYHLRHLDVVAEARRRLAGRPVGLVVASWLDTVPPPAWWRRADRSGGQVVEQATHVLDLIRVLAGEVVEVDARGTTVDGGIDGDVDDATAVLLRFASGAVGVLAATSLLQRKAHAGVQVATPGLLLEVHEMGLVVDDGAGGRLERPAEPDSAKLAVDRAFVDAVRGTGDPAAIGAPYEEALRTHRLGCAVARSAAERRPLRVAARDG